MLLITRPMRLISGIAVALSVIASYVTIAGANSAAPIHFGMIGIVAGDTLRLNVFADSGEPCVAQIGFLDDTGVGVGPSAAVDLSPGQAASLDLSGDILPRAPSQRVEVRPVVTSTDGKFFGTRGCLATVEILAKPLGTERLLTSGGTMMFPDALPTFGLITMGVLQTLRLNVVALDSSARPSSGCNVQLGFVDRDGSLVGPSRTVNLLPGHVDFVDLPFAEVESGALSTHQQVRPTLMPLSETVTCLASAEVFNRLTGKSLTYVGGVPARTVTRLSSEGSGGSLRYTVDTRSLRIISFTVEAIQECTLSITVPFSDTFTRSFPPSTTTTIDAPAGLSFTLFSSALSGDLRLGLIPGVTISTLGGC